MSSHLSVMFLDFDNFKSVNDRYGHDVGDELIKQVGQRLSQCVRGNEVIARLGGDEFLIIAKTSGAEVSIRPLVDRIQQCQGELYLSGGNPINVNFSIGIANYPSDGDTTQDLLRASDIAMYEAKRLGGGNVCFYTEELGNKILERHTLLVSLKKALNNDEFYLVYQPIVHDESGSIKGYEALIRWELEGRVIDPKLVIALGEEVGVSHGITQWVMKTAFSETKSLLKKGQFLALNVSPKQFFDPEFVSCVKAITKEYGFAPSSLELEITESSIITDFKAVVFKLKQLKDLGVHVAIDDFGTGYSSLYRLKHLQVDRLKIDRSFLTDVIADGRNNGIYRTIINLARTLEMDIVSEGVETKEQVAFLTQFGSLYMQGYYFQKPMRIEELIKNEKRINEVTLT